MLNFRKHARVKSKNMSAAFRQYILLNRNLHECKPSIMEILKRSTVRKVATFFMNENCGTRLVMFLYPSVRLTMLYTNETRTLIEIRNNKH